MSDRSFRHAGHTVWSNAGAVAAARWLDARGIRAPEAHWEIQIALDVADRLATLDRDARTDSRFHIDLYREEWGFVFCHGGQQSWIRVTDLPFVHGRDDFGLLARAPAIEQIGALVRTLERRHDLRFRRDLASIRASVEGAEPAIRRWVLGL
ncbi:MAG TPA: hypothetical protein VLX92_30560 [Kofleriaceae bacterium]|nr:hypothetical protein [Kofleriaceae bacterium]